MTDAVDVMARGGGQIDAMARAAYEAMGFLDPWDSLRPQVKAKWRRAQIDAIRALHEAGGLVVARMPDDLPMMRTPEGYALVRGHNAALAAVRAAAVDVKP